MQHKIKTPQRLYRCGVYVSATFGAYAGKAKHHE